jgi:hypothetical protein
MKLLTEEERKQLEIKADKLFKDEVAAENYEKHIALVNQLAGALNQITYEYAEQLGLTEDQTKNLQDGMNAIGGIAKIASGDYIGGAVDHLSSVGKYLIDAPEKVSEHFEHIQEQISKVITSLDIAQKSLSNLGKDNTVTSIKIIKAELMGLADEAKKLNEELGKSSTQKRRPTEINLPAKDIVKQSADLNAEIEKLTNRLLKGDLSDDQRKAIEALLNSYNDLLGVIDNTIQDITGTTINDLGRNLAEAFLTGENAAEAWGDKVDDIIKNVIIRQLTAQLLTKPITDAVNTLINDSTDSNGLTPEEAKKFKETMTNISDTAGPTFDLVKKSMESIGIDFGSSASNAASGVTGSVKGASEETTAALVGQLMAIRVDIKEILKISAMGQDDAANSLLYLRQIANNTSYNIELVGIKQELIDMHATIKRNG